MKNIIRIVVLAITMFSVVAAQAQQDEFQQLKDRVMEAAVQVQVDLNKGVDPSASVAEVYAVFARVDQIAGAPSGSFYAMFVNTLKERKSVVPEALKENYSKVINAYEKWAATKP